MHTIHIVKVIVQDFLIVLYQHFHIGVKVCFLNFLAFSYAFKCFHGFYQQLEDADNKKENIILFPPSDQKTQEFHMLTMMQDLAASLLMEFEKWVLRAESSGTILKTPLDSQSSLGSEEVYSLGVLRTCEVVYLILKK